MSIDAEAVRRAAGSTPDPEIRVTIADLNLLDEIEIDGDHVTVHYHLTSPLCPSQFATKIGKDIRKRVLQVPGVASCTVQIQDHFLGEELQRLVNGASTGGRKRQPIINLEPRS